MRVEGRSKISATRSPSQHGRAVRGRLQLSGAVEQPVSSGAGQLGAGEEMAGQVEQSTYARWVRVLTWNLLHGRSVPPLGATCSTEFSALIALVGLGRGAPPGGAALVAGAPGRAGERRGADGAHVPQLAARRPPGDRRALAGRDQVERRRRQRDPRARERRSSSSAPARLGWWPERRWMHAVRLASGPGWEICTRTPTRARACGRRRRCSAGRREHLSFWAATSTSTSRAARAPRAGGHGVDQVYVSAGLAGAGLRVLDRGRLSDHAPVLVSVVALARTDQSPLALRALRRPKPRSTSSAFSPSVPRAGSTPS